MVNDKKEIFVWRKYNIVKKKDIQLGNGQVLL